MLLKVKRWSLALLLTNNNLLSILSIGPKRVNSSLCEESKDLFTIQMIHVSPKVPKISNTIQIIHN